MPKTDLEWMEVALFEARAAEAACEVPVGAIVVAPDGETLLSRGNNTVMRANDPTAHAEVVAMREAGLALGNYRLTGCTMYSTLEPCAMCAGAILHARLSRLVFAARDPKAGACGSALGVMNHPSLNHQVEVSEGLLAAECGHLLSDFFRRRRAAEPFRTASDLADASDPKTEAELGAEADGAALSGGVERL